MGKKRRWGLYRYKHELVRHVPHPYSVFELGGGEAAPLSWELLAEGAYEDMHRMVMLLLKQAQLDGNHTIDLERSEELYQRERKRADKHGKYFKEALNAIEERS